MNPAASTVSAESPSPWNRRRFLAALGLGALGASVACRREAAAPVQIWVIWPLSPGTAPAGLIERLRLALPDVPIEVNSIWTNNLKDKLRDAARHGALPDVFTLNSAWVDEIGGLRSLTDLAPLAARDGLDLEKLVVPHDLARCRTPQGLLSLPAVSASGTAMLFTNHQLLAQLALPEPPRFERWEELREVSTDFMRRANRAGVLEYLSLDPFSGPGLPLHTTLSFGLGAPILAEDGRRALLDSAGSFEAAEALDRFVHDVYAPFGGYRGLLHFRHHFAGQHRQPSYYSAPYRRQLFTTAAAGTIAVLRGLGIRGNEISVQPVPGLRGLQGGLRSHWWAYGINPASHRLTDAWRVVRFLSLEREGGGKLCLDYGRPAHLQTIRDAEFLAAVGPAWTGIKEAVALDRAYPASPGEDFLRPLLFEVPMRRLQGESMMTIFRDLNARFQGYLDRRSEPVV